MIVLVKCFGGGDVVDMFCDVVVLLCNVKVVDVCMSLVLVWVYDLDDDFIYCIKEMYEQLMEEVLDGVVWMLFLIMGCLEQFWEIFCVIEWIGKCGDDLVVFKIELVVVGDVVLVDIGFFVIKLKFLFVNLEEVKKIYECYDCFVVYFIGMIKEFGICKVGCWGQVLFSLCVEVLINIEKIFEKVLLVLDSGFFELCCGKSGWIIFV